MKTSAPGLALHLGLFVATCLTTTWAGVLYNHPEVGAFDLARLIPLGPDGLSFSVSLMGILLTHEMGHFLTARLHGVPASLPYFLPVPLPMVGTMGAVIRMAGPIRKRNALVDIGASGPLAGLAVAVPVLAYGLHISPVQPQVSGGLLEGNSLLYMGLKLLVKGAVYPTDGLDVFLHPMAWAGWVGLLVTMINLIPIGQLDGGHIAHAYLGGLHNRTSAWLHRGLLLMGVLASVYAVWEAYAVLQGVAEVQRPLALALQLRALAGLPWLTWALVILVLKRLSGAEYHPPVEGAPLSSGRRLLCLAMLLVFVAILVPIPSRISVAP